MKHLLFDEIGKDGKRVRSVSITQAHADELNKRSAELKKAKSNDNYFTYELVKKQPKK